MAKKLITLINQFNIELNKLKFPSPITHVYNPLSYAKAPHLGYIRRYAKKSCKALLIGMNPGPWGMLQTGVPFGEVNLVRDWLKIEKPVAQPQQQHPKRPILGFTCKRSEVSGLRVWSWARKRYKKPENFFKHYFIWNYCPLAFFEQAGRNITPDKIPSSAKRGLFETCDWALLRAVQILKPEIVIGIGKFTEQRAKIVLQNLSVKTGTILHPSPASPLANRGWSQQAETQLKKLGALF